MNWHEWLDNRRMVSLSICVLDLKMEWVLEDADRDAMGGRSIDLINRVATQSPPQEIGEQQTVATSIYALFALTRDMIKRRGRLRQESTRPITAVPYRIVHPFSTEWHPLSARVASGIVDRCVEFSFELKRPRTGGIKTDFPPRNVRILVFSVSRLQKGYSDAIEPVRYQPYWPRSKRCS
jgi:hypothetical protein